MQASLKANIAKARKARRLKEGRPKAKRLKEGRLKAKMLKEGRLKEGSRKAQGRPKANEDQGRKLKAGQGQGHAPEILGIHRANCVDGTASDDDCESHETRRPMA